MQPQIYTKNFYGGLYYTDIGYGEECNTVADGSYQQVVIHLDSHLPVRLPLSMCLPKQCNDSSYVQPILDGVVAAANKGSAGIKAKMSFDEFYSFLDSDTAKNTLFKYSGDQDKQLLQ